MKVVILLAVVSLAIMFAALALCPIERKDDRENNSGEHYDFNDQLHFYGDDYDE